MADLQRKYWHDRFVPTTEVNVRAASSLPTAAQTITLFVMTITDFLPGKQ